MNIRKGLKELVDWLPDVGFFLNMSVLWENSSVHRLRLATQLEATEASKSEIGLNRLH